MAENYQQAAKDIIQLIGMDNIISVTHMNGLPRRTTTSE